jgi:hypothetical protein
MDHPLVFLARIWMQLVKVMTSMEMLQLLVVLAIRDPTVLILVLLIHRRKERALWWRLWEIRDTMQSNSDVAKKVMEREYRSESIKKAMRLVVESGAPEGSVEHYMAMKLFVKAENWDIFFTFETNDGRIAWLKRNCQDYDMYH